MNSSIKVLIRRALCSYPGFNARSARYGDRKLFWNLQRDGVSREIAEEALKQNEESEYDRALVLWKRKFGEPPEDYKERAKQIRFLASRGFTFKTIEKS